MPMKDVIAAIRKEAGITQEEMALRLYVTRQAVSRWETEGGQNGIERLITENNIIAGRYGCFQKQEQNRSNSPKRFETLQTGSFVPEFVPPQPPERRFQRERRP